MNHSKHSVNISVYGSKGDPRDVFLNQLKPIQNGQEIEIKWMKLGAKDLLEVLNRFPVSDLS